MGVRRPLVRVDGRVRQIQSGDTVDPAYLSANLAAFAGLTGAANKAPYFTAAGAMAVYDLTVFGRSVVAAADAAALRTLLGLGSAATRDASATPAASTVPLRDASGFLQLGTVLSDFLVRKINATGSGGRINLEVSDTATISAVNRRLSVDILHDNFRVYESGSPARGLYIEMASLLTGATSNYTKQTSIDDATAGRLLAVGAGGLLGSELNVSQRLISDFASFYTTGFYYGVGAGAPVGIASLNAPPGSGYVGGTVLYLRYAATQAVFIFSQVTAAAAARRTWIGVNISGTVYWNEISTTADQSDSGWIQPTLSNSWANQSGNPIKYRLRYGKLEWCGRATNATTSNNTTSFTLPSGYRPNKPLTLHGGGNTGGGNTCLVTISTAGVVTFYDTSTQGSTATIDLDGVSCLLDY